MILRLIFKEAHEHRWAAIGVVMLAVAQYLAFLQFSLRHEPPTALVAATNFVWGTGPMIAAYTARRLFVLEQEQRTIQLLRSLPISPGLVTATKLLLGLVYNLAVSLSVLWVSAWFLRNQEIISADWLQRLSVQAAAYVFAWYALAAFHAHLGGYRFAVWLVFFVALLSLDDVFDNPTRSVFWTAALADDIETTRYQTPWDAVWLSAGWGFGATMLTVVLAGYRGGAWVDSWFAPMSGRRRAEVTGVAIVAMLLLEVSASAVGRQPGLLPARPAEPWLKATSEDLRPLAVQTTKTIDELRARYGIVDPPRALLRFRRDSRSEPVLTRILKSGDLVVGVRPDAPSEDRLRDVVSDVLTGLSAGHWERVPATGAWALGFAPFVLNDDRLASTAARLAGQPASVLDDFEALRERFGRRGVEAAGWLGWRALKDVGDDGAVKALANALFDARRTQTSGGLAVARRTSPDAVLDAAGVNRAAFDAAWARLVTDAAERSAPPFDVALPEVVLERPEQAAPRFTWTDLPPPVFERKVELWWSVATDLYPYAVPAGELHVARIEPDMAGHIVLVDPRLRIIVTWVVDGEVQGWREVHR